jgi:hypothetical protein
MSEWAYRNCKCGNRIHINFICEKCDGDPWNIRIAIQNYIDNLISEKKRLLDEISNINRNIEIKKEKLKRTYHLLANLK